jgi:tetratricopeptide (TPR) repeat protein
MKIGWKHAGIIATGIIVVVIPLQVIKFHFQNQERGGDFPNFTGSASCIECHQIEYDLWKGSDHEKAMDQATDQSVRGDFNNAVLDYKGFQNRFYRKGEKFFVYTQGPEGKPGEFEISYTFGVRPLQQYLIEFEGGRLQCLPIAWDTEKKQWFHLVPVVYQNEDIPPDDWLYWTNFGQNWNGMCADCHSTQLIKNLNPKTLQFGTEWHEINVGCEACHGPGSAHLDWAKLPEGNRPMDINTGLTVKTSNINNREYIDNCARCHSRRTALTDFDNKSNEFLDYCVPQIAVSPVYYDDGQILEENYVYASFLQSKMYMKGVKCSDCHNAHSLKFIKEGNDLCLQCHRADQYDVYSHHFHKKNGLEHQAQAFNSPPQNIEGEGARCINCHMDGRYYMGVDYRRDHSFRIPRPDLTLEMNVPNACNSCHSDKSAQWSQDYILKWYGISSKPHYGSIFAKGKNGDPLVFDKLAAIIVDELQPPMVRASGLGIIGNYRTQEARKVLKSVIGHSDPLIRTYAARSFSSDNINELKEVYLPLLYDPVRSVRMEAAFRLSYVQSEINDTLQKTALLDAIAEYEQSMRYTGDFAASNHNLGILYTNLGKNQEAVEAYRRAILIDDKFYPAKVNLATTLNNLGKNDEAEKLLKDVQKLHPELSGINYSLGLLLAEMKKYDEALFYLEKATLETPVNPRSFYNLGLLLNQLGNKNDAEKALLIAVKLDSQNSSFIYAMSTFYLQKGDRTSALEYAKALQKLLPEDAGVKQFISELQAGQN